MSDNEKKNYLTIHGHFYQPPRENPWLEAIELQESASPFHDWNARICDECYNPNSASRIVDGKNRIIDIVNNYTMISFNFGPTLMSWMEQYAPNTYERIVQADRKSIGIYSGHGNAIAQVYNHMIMPLANDKDKYTQTIWGIKDFEYRFGRKPEGIWLAETATDDRTMEVLIDCGIKFTILSPYQAARVRKINAKQDSAWEDVSWGSIDPARAYRYFIKGKPDKYIDLFFYDGSISKSVAFDNLLKDGNRFIKRLQDGVSPQRNYNQLVNIATDGESYGHHTRFGDMALSYALKKRAKDAGFTITNYGEYLEKNPPLYEVDIKPVSSWSCFHGVERWRDDCGCSTGAQPGWNQKWRKPLRDALNYLRDELAVLYEEQISKYLDDPWESRNDYISVMLDRNEISLGKFFKKHQRRELSSEEKTLVLKLLEIQRQAMLMFTSCGWFFADISGIETTQIMKYAARAIELAETFTDKDYETPFLNILEKAQSNIKDMGNGKEIYQKFVKPSVVTTKQIIAQWAISSLYQDFEDETELYSYNINRLDYRKIKNAKTVMAFGRIKVTSKITLETNDMMFVIIKFANSDFHCAIKEFSNQSNYNKIKNELLDKYMNASLTDIMRAIDINFGLEYFSVRNLFQDERKDILKIQLKNKINRSSQTFKSLYDESKTGILQLGKLGVHIPEYDIMARYSLSKDFNALFNETADIFDEELIHQAVDINNEAKTLNIQLSTKSVNKLFIAELYKNLNKLSKNMEISHAEVIINLLDTASKIGLKLNLAEAQNIYFNNIYIYLDDIFELIRIKNQDSIHKKLVKSLIIIGQKLNINMEYFEEKASQL
ncbi:MAG TPA: DUF3536 domain-containing protein [Candidatus Adamsella sp.]|nr:DUF3536 domain-containing protein [Candidatus Adamsella sp.]